MNPRNYETPDLEKFLRDNQGIDVAILAAEIGIQESKLVAYQRRLGLRKIASWKDYRK